MVHDSFVCRLNELLMKRHSRDSRDFAGMVKYEQVSVDHQLFRCRAVLNWGVDAYAWSHTHSSKKAAKQEAARLALESLGGTVHASPPDEPGTCTTGETEHPSQSLQGPNVPGRCTTGGTEHSSQSRPGPDVEGQCTILGWAIEMAQAGAGKWLMTVKAHECGRREVLVFEAEGRNHKAGRLACLEKAQESARLRALVDKELSKVEMTLDDAFTHDFCTRGGRIVPASAAAWGELRQKLQAKSGAEKVVGIDVEGVNHRPPLLVQVAAAGMVVLEVPSRGLSEGLQQLLKDTDVLKVLCDGSLQDRNALGISDNPSRYNICDLEEMANSIFGKSSNQRGLCKILSLSQAAGMRRYVKNKSGCKYFIRVDRGFIRPPRSIVDIPKNALHYAGADAWATLVSWQGLTASMKAESGGDRVAKPPLVPSLPSQQQAPPARDGGANHALLLDESRVWATKGSTPAKHREFPSTWAPVQADLASGSWGRGGSGSVVGEGGRRGSHRPPGVFPVARMTGGGATDGRMHVPGTLQRKRKQGRAGGGSEEGEGGRKRGSHGDFGRGGKRMRPT